ncbi:MAG: PIG-L family deacetylase, partial [Ferruginibacter sp.]
KFEKDVYLFRERKSRQVDLKLIPNIDITGNINLQTTITDSIGRKENGKAFTFKNLSKDKPVLLRVELPVNNNMGVNSTIHAILTNADKINIGSNSYKRIISYDHIPSIVYQKEATAKSVYADFRIAGKLVGYIAGAGDKVPQALNEMGYKVVMLTQKDIRANNLKQFDAIVTGVRAYNVNEWMNNVYDELMDYVKDGGILLTQYNTSSQAGPVKAKIAPYPFAISRNRVTDEAATVHFLLPAHPALNYPNKITEKDFEGWVQERSIYNAEKIDSNYHRVLSMKDPGEDEQDGSLIIANYGKGRFVYTGLVFFRELPAGVPGAYRLFANLIAVGRDDTGNGVNKVK